MKEYIERYLELKETLTTALKEYVKDKSIPVDERWEAFIKADVAPIDGTYHDPDGIDWNKYTLYDDFYCDRYATIKANSILELCKDMASDEEGFEYDPVAIKEYFMDNFISGFINDW